MELNEKIYIGKRRVIFECDWDSVEVKGIRERGLKESVDGCNRKGTLRSSRLL